MGRRKQIQHPPLKGTRKHPGLIDTLQESNTLHVALQAAAVLLPYK